MSDLSAVIVAAGHSKRMGRLGDKIWIHVAGRPVLFYSLRSFLQSGVRRIVVVARPGDERRVQQFVRRAFPRADICVVAGGSVRQDSVRNGVSACGTDFVLIHDAARPAVSPAMIRAVVRETRRSGACVPAVPVADTVKRVLRGRVVRTEDRSELFAVQTPQGFRRAWLLQALDRARREKITATDCSALVERMKKRVRIVAGDPRNLKLTSPSDLIVLKSILGRP